MNHCGCNDWQVTQRRALLRRQGQVVPIPRAVLEGEAPACAAATSSATARSPS